MPRADLIDTLLRSAEPAVRYRLLVGALGEDPCSRSLRELQAAIAASPRVVTLLSARGDDGRFPPGRHVYAKWQGAHWVLAALADVGYPPGDERLAPMANQVLDRWLHDGFFTEFEAQTKAAAYRTSGVPVMLGRHRRCASQQGNALHFLTRLGLVADRTQRLVERLLHWQWPDGGWNCDKHPGADTSSFMETLLPMRGLFLYARAQHDPHALAAARNASEVLLTRRLFKRRSDGEVIHPEFLKLHYPLYWHYDFLGGLKALAEAGLVGDPRCDEALDLLESRELPSGGWPAQSRYYHVSSAVELGADSVDWGGTSRTRLNEWVTTDALYVLRAAGRLSGRL